MPVAVDVGLEMRDGAEGRADGAGESTEAVGEVAGVVSLDFRAHPTRTVVMTTSPTKPAVDTLWALFKGRTSASIHR